MAVCGENNFYKNSVCWKIFTYLEKKKIKNKDMWFNLCELWSSDYRTHTNKKKNLRFHKLVLKLFNKLKIKRNNNEQKKLNIFKKIKLSNTKNVNINNNFISFYTKKFILKLNLKKGLTIDQFTDKTISKNPLFGTVYQGQLDYLENLSDYYSGISIFFCTIT